MRRILPVFTGLALALGTVAVSRADDYKEKSKTKVEHNGDVKVKTKAHEEQPGPDYNSKSKTKIEKDGDVKYKEKSRGPGGKEKVKTKVHQEHDGDVKVKTKVKDH